MFTLHISNILKRIYDIVNRLGPIGTVVGLLKCKCSVFNRSYGRLW